MERQRRAARAKLAAAGIGVVLVAAAIAAGVAISPGGGASGGRPGGTPGGQRPAGAVNRAMPPSVRVASGVPPSAGPAASPPSARVASGVPASTTLAAVRHSTPGYASPGGRGTGTVPATTYGRPSVLPVIAARPGWVRVRLARRPNGATAWLSASDVALRRTPYRIVIQVASMHLSLYDRGRRVFSAPAGVGAPDDPTPPGEFFVQFDEPPPQPGSGYGPFVMVTSAHSTTISNWEGSGDALVGIHGPLGEDSAIGTTGARVSHGCVRLHLRTLEQLRQVPAGTPIDIVG